MGCPEQPLALCGEAMSLDRDAPQELRTTRRQSPAERKDPHLTVGELRSSLFPR